MRLLILLMLLAFVPLSCAEALDDVPTLDLNEDTIDFATPDVNEGATSFRDDVTTPGINEGATESYWSRRLDRHLGRRS